MSWSVVAEDNSIGSITIPSGATVLVVMANWTSGSPTYCRFNGVDMTLAVSVALSNNAAGIWFLNNPEITTGAITTDVTFQSGGAYIITGTKGETAAVRDTDTTTHENNDFIGSGVTTVAGDLVFYSGSKTGGGVWTNVDDTVASGARETAVGASTSGTWGDAGDAQIVACSAGLKIKPLAGGNVILYL